MKYVWVVLALLACVLSALAGLTAGLNLNPISTVRFVPNWGSVGDWVAGLGAFFAVGAAMWQFHIQRKEDLEGLVIDQAQGKDRWRFSIVSKGKRPARVQWVGFYSQKIDTILPIKSFIFHEKSAVLPQTLGYAESIDFITHPDTFLDLALNADHTFNGSLSDLEIHVQTTLGFFRSPVIEETKLAFRNAIQRKFDEARQ